MAVQAKWINFREFKKKLRLKKKKINVTVCMILHEFKFVTDFFF